MMYESSRSLCYNIAQQIGMSEVDMRLAINAKTHIKEKLRQAGNCFYAADFILSKDEKVCVMISMEKSIDAVDYMVSEIDMDEYTSISKAMADIGSWAPANATYYNSKSLGHMAKIQALIETSNRIGGKISPINYW